MNTFGPLVDGVELPGSLHFPGRIAFEQQRSAWAGGYWPTLDLIVEADGSSPRLFVESKCTEFLRKGAADFSTAFVQHAKQHLGREAAQSYELLVAEAAAFDPLDARQLAKHFLAAKRAVLECADNRSVVLLCVWWEPADASAFPVFKRHRHAVDAFADAIPDGDVRIHGMSYRDLWEYWESQEDPVLGRHVAELRGRYDVRLA